MKSSSPLRIAKPSELSEHSRMDGISYTDTASLREKVIHGSAAFPCACYKADATTHTPEESFVCKHHWHDELEILYLEEGTYRLEINMDRYDITGPCLVFVRSGELHALFCDGPFTERAIVFSPEILHFIGNDPVQKAYLDPLIRNELALPRLVADTDAAFFRLQALYKDMLESFREAGSDSHGRPNSRYSAASPAGQLRIKADLLAMLAELADHDMLQRDTPTPDMHVELVKDSITYMREHYAEKLYISDLAKQANLNKEYFCRFFKNALGKPPMEYLNELRIREAVRMLQETDKAVADIALACGFNNLGNFNRTFKKCTGDTPLHYRRSRSQ